ncbi:hypothetical protein CMI38_02700 [Candidatus Pacearchaeota archaeon]|nr:hypothetical protein [Candidatus Pacearchaeota archaeon]|tara:strand:- start:8626 stop:8835 length:210 start_codon:yes stop_codon:yes gene_type:complete
MKYEVNKEIGTLELIGESDEEVKMLSNLHTDVSKAKGTSHYDLRPSSFGGSSLTYLICDPDTGKHITDR